ncbi:glycosyltransferase family 2 protein [Thiomicrorhabdus sp. Kp2]|uniref:glycosyltransferase family 2 protein n=1 Tax=Thiomicrorhabdus sp. Kp2 TaxID=1123518 RepID=UPI00041E5A47|nr:glycosyltransferase family 2 protein [Thiomicrorhabdus sp. Kp2]
MSEVNPKIGLVTVLYNGKEVLPEFFESLAKQTYKNYVLYVIDNSPNDEALDLAKILAKKYAIPTEFIKNNANLGVAKGNNQGIELSLAASFSFVLLLNNDIDFEGNVIENMVRYAVEHNENIVVPKIYYAGTNKIWMAGGDFSMLRGTMVHRGDQEEDIGQYNKIGYVSYAPTCFMLINSTLFSDVGMMDEKYFVYYDDSDWIWRAKILGYKVLYLPEVTVNHQVSFSTGGSENDFTLFYGNRNRLYFILKHFNYKFFIPLMFYLLSRVFKYFSLSKKKKGILLKAIKKGSRLNSKQC